MPCPSTELLDDWSAGALEGICCCDCTDASDVFLNRDDDEELAEELAEDEDFGLANSIRMQSV
jgi:hypothetical protein